MAYEVALSKAWSELSSIASDSCYSLQFLADEYTINLKEKNILSLSCNVPAKEFVSILLLHYLVRELRGLPPLQNEWVTFEQLDSGKAYFPAFKKRAIDPIIRKYKSNPEALRVATERFGAQLVNYGDIGIVINAFLSVPVLIEFWKGDDEFDPQVTMLFDKSITKIFCTEDIVVLAGFVASSI